MIKKQTYYCFYILLSKTKPFHIIETSYAIFDITVHCEDEYYGKSVAVGFENFLNEVKAHYPEYDVVIPTFNRV